MAAFGMANPIHDPSSSSEPPLSPHAENLANDSNLHMQGYPKLAYFFAQCPRYLHLRLFAALSIRTMLYRQHKLELLERRLLKLEGENRGRDQSVCNNFEFLEDEPEQLDEVNREIRSIYDMTATVLKDQEESFIRFDKLSKRCHDGAGLREIQRFLAQKEGGGLSLSGVDGGIWGSEDNPSEYAFDIFQVIQQKESSMMVNFMYKKFSLWAPKFPRWIQILLYQTLKKPDVFLQYSYSAKTFDNITMAVGNIVASLLVYAAVTSLYLATGKALKIVAVILIGAIVTLCSIAFQNQSFVVMLATVCAVLVTQLANDNRSNSGS